MEAENIGINRNEDGTFGKGNPGKPKGAVTKISAKVRESIVNFLESNVDQIQQDFDKLKPRERLQFVAEILPYATPKMASIQSENELNVTGGITIRWQDPDLPNPENKGST
ncbi:MAG TPA: hypothetical protein VFU05_02815 [Cyclobacteriaceae bacterium]|nr:hypothetical protein [Cyclobacteriaceae bacterium]